MRSSKSRSRSKNNRNRPAGNNMNRVFDSSGPDGRVRGTPQQIIEKYNQLAADAHLSNDVVAAENFQQHAEHYTRLQAEALREQEARREQQEREHRERQQARNEQQQQPQNRRAPDEQPAVAPDAGFAVSDPGQGDQPDIIAPAQTGESSLVETPESAPQKRRASKPRTRKPRTPKPEAPEASADTAGEGSGQSGAGDTQPDAPKAAE